MKRLSTFKKYFLSYILIIVISIMFIMSIYNIFVKTKKEELFELNISYLTQIKQLVDGQIRSISNTVNLVALSPDVTSLFNIKGEITSTDRLKISKCLNSLHLYTSALDISTSIHLQIFEPSMLFTASSVYYNNRNLYVEDHYGIDVDQFDDIVKSNYQSKLTRLHHLIPQQLGDDYLYYFQSIPLNSKNKTLGTIIVEINEKKLKSYFNYNSKMLGSFYMLDSHNNILLSNSDTAFPSDIRYDDLIDNEVIYYQKSNQNYVICTLDSENENIKYVTIIPESIFWDKVRKLKNNMIIVVLSFFILCTILSFFLANKNYLPVKNIAKKAAKFNKDTIYKDDYEMIDQALENTLEQQDKMKELICQKKEVTKNLFIFRLLKGRITDENDIKAKFKLHNIEIRKSNIIVLLFKLNDYPININNKDMDNVITILKFIENSVYDLIILNKMTCISTEIDEQIICIVNLETKEDYKQKIKDILFKVYAQVNKEFDINITATVSDIHMDVTSIPIAFRETQEALLYTKLLGNVEVIFYQDTLESKRIYTYPTEKEQCIINNLKIVNAQKVKEIIDEILLSTQKDNLSIESVQLYYFNILSSIFKTINTNREKEIINNLLPMKRLMASKNVDEMKNIIFELVDQICIIKDDEKNNLSIEKKVNKYINDNFNDINLNVANIGEYFKTTPVYLSKLYTQETGQTILNVINFTRIKKAKELLKDDSLTINEISKRIGYSYDNTFIRIFKKYEGITPGQYKLLISDKK